MPFGFFVALLRRGASPAQRIGYSIAIGAAMSFAMESLQMYIPPRVASPFDLAANAVGALLGGVARDRARAQRIDARLCSTVRAHACSCRAIWVTSASR